MKKNCFITIAIFILYSCTNDTRQPSSSQETPLAKTDSFFPVTSFIKGQMITLDSLPITPLQLTTINGKTDSAWIAKDKLNEFYSSFLTPVISETNLTEYFKESSFSDQTLNTITFTYDPIGKLPDSISLRHWDVYIDPETGNVNKVYIVKQIKTRGQTITRQLTWQSNKMAKISTILNKPDGSMWLEKEVVLIWDFSGIIK
jgi:hypothetical protein